MKRATRIVPARGIRQTCDTMPKSDIGESRGATKTAGTSLDPTTNPIESDGASSTPTVPCPRCGYNLGGHGSRGTCPECGLAFLDVRRMPAAPELLPGGRAAFLGPPAAAATLLILAHVAGVYGGGIWLLVPTVSVFWSIVNAARFVSRRDYNRRATRQRVPRTDRMALIFGLGTALFAIQLVASAAAAFGAECAGRLLGWWT